MVMAVREKWNRSLGVVSLRCEGIVNQRNDNPMSMMTMTMSSVTMTVVGWG